MLLIIVSILWHIIGKVHKLKKLWLLKYVYCLRHSWPKCFPIKVDQLSNLDKVLFWKCWHTHLWIAALFFFYPDVKIKGAPQNGIYKKVDKQDTSSYRPISSSYIGYKFWGF